MRLVLALLVIPSLAAADDFQPALDARGYFTQNASATLGHGDLSFGLGSLDWGRHPVAGVDDMVTATLVGAAGFHLGIPFELGATLPLGVQTGLTDSQQVGNLGLHLKARLLHAGPLGLGAIGSVYVPSGDVEGTGVIDATAGRFRIALNAGVRRRTLMEMTTTEAIGGVAAAYALVPEKIEAVAEIAGTRSHVEALGGVKVYLAKNSYLSLAAGHGIDQGGLRAMIAIVFEPKPAARTRALIDDTVVAELRPPAPPSDAWSDRDNDGIPDKDDKCPDDPENYNGYEDDDGCPDEEPKDLVIDTGSTLVTLEGIEFEFDRADIKPISFKVLDAVAKAMGDNPDIQLVEVQGHTDEQGDDAYNLDLSNRRAAAVVAYLVGKGVAAERLVSHGYGETQPIDPAHTQAAYKKNRRVVFQIKDRR
ncbi:MAG: OmpA family protein [Deltaproteobacteria bacterium]|nr:OmpA family protein [Deltaproteobacteria bacterium]